MNEVFLTPKQEERLARIRECTQHDEAVQLVYEWIKKGTIDLLETKRLIRSVPQHDHIN